MNAHTSTKPAGSNGVMPIALGWRFAWMKFDIIGGPFNNYAKVKEATFGVCVRAEQVPIVGVNVHLPIQDFSIPKDDREVEVALIETITAAIRGDSVYVGCMGGWGRTGLFLALIAKAVGIADPVKYVRSTYTPHAVETDMQAAYVAGFDVSHVQAVIQSIAWRERIRNWLRLKW